MDARPGGSIAEDAGPYILDIGVWARFVVAITVFIHAEGRVEKQ
jgi:hypothetical protein